MEPQQLTYLGILAAVVVVLMSERLRNDVVALLIVVALSVSGLLTPSEALRGFSSEPAIVVAGIFVLSGALHQTGVSETIGAWIGRWAGSGLTRAIAVIMPAVAVLSAFTHHLTTTAVMLPVTLNLSREKNIAPSKLLMPLSFAASLGTAITIIGAPAFLLASNALQQAGRPGLGIFSIAPIGIALSVAGTLFMMLVGRFLLPSRKGNGDSAQRFRLDNYFTELTVLPDAPFLGMTFDEVQASRSYEFHVVGWVREGRQLSPPYGERKLRPGDVLLVRTTPEEIVSFQEEKGLEIHALTQYQAETPEAKGEGEDVEERLVQVVVSPQADIAGRTIGEIDFRRRFGAIVVSLWRKEGWLGEEMSKIRLRPGDVLVLLGSPEALQRVAGERDFLMMVPFHGESRRHRKAYTAGAIMLGTILLTAFQVLSLEIAVVAGAMAMVLTRCLTARQAYRAIDARIFVFIAGAVPLGAAMEKSGTSQVIAGWLQGAIAGWSVVAICLALFAVVGVVTQFMSDAATTAIFAPVAVALAQALGHAPEAYVVTVAMAAVASFLTPIGHHGNLLIYGPGGYRFADFVRVGTPLTLVAAVVVAVLAPLLWPA